MAIGVKSAKNKMVKFGVKNSEIIKSVKSTSDNSIDKIFEINFAFSFLKKKLRVAKAILPPSNGYAGIKFTIAIAKFAKATTSVKA